jgi:hypothetical protein
MKYLTILLFPLFCLATPKDDLNKIIELRCDLYNNSIPVDTREACMTDYVNCGVKLGGVIDLKDLDQCALKRKGSKK